MHEQKSSRGDKKKGGTNMRRGGFGGNQRAEGGLRGRGGMKLNQTLYRGVIYREKKKNLKIQ